MKNLNTIDDILAEPIFDNPHFLVGNNPLHAKCPVLRLFTVRDIWDVENKTIRSKNFLERLHNISIPYMLYHQIVGTVSTVIKSIFNKNTRNTSLERCRNIPNKCLSQLDQIKNSEVYSYLLALEYKSPKSQDKWIENYPFLENLDWKPVYLLPNIILSDAYLVTFQYKILHRVFTCNYNLFNWNIIDSSLCDICHKTDNLEHYFYYCTDTKNFWTQVKSWTNKLLSSKIDFTVLEILFGVIRSDPKLRFSINFVILIGKSFVSKCKKNNQELFFSNFLEKLKLMVILEEGVYIRQGKSVTFNERYSLLHDYFK